MKTAIELLEEAKRILGLNQKDFGVYIGVSTRTVNSWFTGDRKCPDHVAETVLRLAQADAQALEECRPTSGMMRWAVISCDTDENVTVCGSKADAIREARTDWEHMTERERKRLQKFEVGLIHVALIDEPVYSGRFAYYRFAYYANADGDIDGTVYETAADYLK